MIYILYSGDYEVFLGGNYRPESEILLEPTRLALDTFESISVPVTLFADLLCLWRYRELGFDEFPDQVDEQLRQVVQRGHDVQMHIHPHWPKTDIHPHWPKTDIEHREDGSTHYHVDSVWIYPGPHIPDIYEFMLKYLVEGKEYLNRLLKEVSPDYQCVAYRAGGYGIVPGEKEILAALEDAGYLIDSSVVPDYPGIDVSGTPVVSFNNVPKRGNYRLSRKWGLTRPAEAGVFEIPLAATVLHDMIPLLCLKLKSLHRQLFRKPKPHVNLGYTIHESFRRNQLVSKRAVGSWIKRMITRGLSQSHWRMMDLTDDTRVMLDVTHNYIRKYQNESKDLFFSVSFHPKDFVASKRDALSKYHRKLQQRYGDGIRAITFCEAANLIPPPPRG